MRSINPRFTYLLTYLLTWRQLDITVCGRHGDLEHCSLIEFYTFSLFCIICMSQILRYYSFLLMLTTWNVNFVSVRYYKFKVIFLFDGFTNFQLIFFWVHSRWRHLTRQRYFVPSPTGRLAHANYWNRTIFAKVIVKIDVVSFLYGTRCIITVHIHCYRIR